MRFAPDFLDELRARLAVSQVVGARVKLRKAGREWKGLSPFNKERTPSFTVNDQKGFFHDFSSGKHGDIFAFVMETEGVTFPEAVERLASMAGLAMPVISREARAEEEKRKSLHDVLELASAYFEAQLAARAGARGRGYLADRAIAPATQRRFRLGYALAERFALKEHLGGQGVAVEDMIAAGLLVAGDDIPLPFDRFRDRVMFPITDLRGRVIAFGGRALEKDVAAKYLNSPETPLFHKGAMLYNAAAARQAAHEGAPVIAVEGYIDVIAMVSAGYAATVAPLGTALTEEQIALLWKMADEPVLLFDGDAAGRRAAYRALDLALAGLQPGKSLRFALLPEGLDPDDAIRSGGREAMAEILAAPRALADMLWARELENGPLDTPERRAGLEARLAAIVNGIAHDAVRKYYRRDFEARLAAHFAPAAVERARGYARQQAPGREARRSDRAGRNPRGAGEALAPVSSRLLRSPIVRGARAALPAREALILRAVINHPWLLTRHAEDLADLELRHPDADLLRRIILDLATAQHEGEQLPLREAISARGQGAALARLEAAITHASDWPVHEETAAADVEQWWTHVITLHRRMRTLNKELKDAERALGEVPTEENLAWLRDVQARLAALDGTEASIEGFGALSGRPARNF